MRRASPAGRRPERSGPFCQVSLMSDWKLIASASVRRFTAEQSDPWHAEALRISRALVEALDAAYPTRHALAPLLVASIALPVRESGATTLRQALIRAYLELDDPSFEAPEVQRGVLA